MPKLSDLLSYAPVTQQAASKLAMALARSVSPTEEPAWKSMEPGVNRYADNRPYDRDGRPISRPIKDGKPYERGKLYDVMSREYMQDMLYGIPEQANPEETKYKNKNMLLNELMYATPGLGEGLSARDAVKAYYQAQTSGSPWDYGNALLAGIGAIPLAGYIARGTARGVRATDKVLPQKLNQLLDRAAPSGDTLYSGAPFPPGALPMDEASRMARAKEMGVRTNMPLYHGTNADINAFDLSRGGQTSRSQAGSQGVSVALDPDTAAEFADLAAGKGGSGQNIVQLLHRADRPAVLELSGSEKNLEIAATLREAWDNGYDAVMMKNYTTPAGVKGKTILVVKDPSQLRSPNAKFDPAKKGSSDLLAGLAGGMLMAPAALNRDEQTRY